jgi:hypothetical protein
MARSLRGPRTWLSSDLREDDSDAPARSATRAFFVMNAELMDEVP